MTIAGNLALQSGALYLVQLNSSTSSFAVVTGTATLGGTVNANFAPGSDHPLRRYTIMETAGVSGKAFSGSVTTNLFQLEFKRGRQRQQTVAGADHDNRRSAQRRGSNTNQQKVGTAINRASSTMAARHRRASAPFSL